MSHVSKFAALVVVIAVTTTTAGAQDQTETTTQVEVQNGAEAPAQTNGAPTQANGAVQINTGSAQGFLQSMATKFGTSVKRLESLLAKLPPNGKGLSNIEIS